MESNYPFLDYSKIREEVLMKNLDMINIEKYNKVIISICKIEDKEGLVKGLGTGFFFKLDQNDKPFYCLVTCSHVLPKKLINNCTKIKIYYDSQQKNINIILNKKRKDL